MTLSYFICVFSERKKEELMRAEGDPGRATATRRTERRRRRKSMGHSYVWIVLLSLSFSQQSIAAQPEGADGCFSIACKHVYHAA